MKTFWVSWYGCGPFEYEGPWWISGYVLGMGEGDTETICAAVMAEDEAHARRIIVEAHEGRAPRIDGVESEEPGGWRFCNEKPEGWSPFGDRFPRADWMKWPFPEAVADGA